MAVQLLRQAEDETPYPAMDTILYDPFTLPEHYYSSYTAPNAAMTGLSNIHPNVPDPFHGPSGQRKAQQLRLRMRARPIPQLIWDRHKPAIEDLYLHQDLNLDQVRSKMLDKYKFEAT